MWVYEVACRRRFYPIDFTRAEVLRSEEKSTTEMKDLDINIGHNRQPPGPRRRRHRARLLSASSLCVHTIHPSHFSWRRQPPCDGIASKAAEAEVARRRSALLVHARSPFQSDSQRNIWPGRPDVSYWRNMARSREIFPLEALASGDVYLNNYFLTPSYGAYATPPAAIFPAIPSALLGRNSLCDIRLHPQPLVPARFLASRGRSQPVRWFEEKLKFRQRKAQWRTILEDAFPRDFCATFSLQERAQLRYVNSRLSCKSYREIIYLSKAKILWRIFTESFILKQNNF